MVQEAHVENMQKGYTIDQTPQYGLYSVKIRVPVQGAYPNVVNFIKDIEESDTFFIINSIDVRSNPGAGPADSDIALDLNIESAPCRASFFSLGLRRQPCNAFGQTRAALGEDHRVRRREIGRQRRWRVRHIRNESWRRRNATPFCYPAACGRHVSCGIRQSIPSSR